MIIINMEFLTVEKDMLRNYTALALLNITVMALVLHMIASSSVLPKRSSRFFMMAISLTIAAIVSEIGTLHCAAASKPYVLLHKLFNVIGFGVTPLIPLLISFAVGEKRGNRNQFLLIPAALNALLCLLSVRYGLIFRVSDANVYSRGPLFFVFLGAYFLSIIWIATETRDAVHRYQDKSGSTLLLICVFFVVGTSVQLLFPQIYLTWACATMSFLIYYAFYCELSLKFDPLTRLFNRRMYENSLENLAESAFIIVFDVDDFKMVNDTYGHPAGDQALAVVSTCILDAFSALGRCYRIGGDEFCVIIPGHDEDTVQAGIRRFLKLIIRERAADYRLPLVSLGYAHYDRAHSDPASAIAAADKQMYQFKQQRKTDAAC